MHPVLRHLGHRFLPFLVEPYRKVRFKIIDLMQFPRELREVIELRHRRFSTTSDTAVLYERYYTDTPSVPGAVSGVIYMANGKTLHGGLTDRLRGILTIYSYVRRLGLPFYIYWDTPFVLEDYLQPSDKVDWRVGPERLSYSRADSFPVVIWQGPGPQALLVNRLMLDMALRKPLLRQIHIHTNADNARGEYRSLYAELFKPTPLLQTEVDRNLAAIGAPYWAFTFRFLNLLGDFDEHDNRELPAEEKDPFVKRVLAEFLKVAQNVPEGYRILVTSDSRSFLEYVRDKDKRIYVVPGDVKNIDLAKGIHKGAWLKTFTDQQLLMRAERVFLMKTGRMYKSGFPRFAAEIGGKPYVLHSF